MTLCTRDGRKLDDTIISYRACGWPGCREPKGHKGRCAPSAPRVLNTPGVQVGKGGVFSEEDIRKAAKAVERQCIMPPLGPLDLPGGPAPRTVPQDPESVEDERAAQEALLKAHERMRHAMEHAKARAEEQFQRYARLLPAGRELAKVSDEEAAEFRRRVEAAKRMEESIRPD